MERQRHLSDAAPFRSPSDTIYQSVQASPAPFSHDYTENSDMPPANNSKPTVETEAESTMKIFRNVAGGTDTVQHAMAEIQKDREMYGIGSDKEQIYTERVRAKLVKENLLPDISLNYAKENFYRMSGKENIDEQSLFGFRKNNYEKMTPVEKAMNHYLRDHLENFDHTTGENKNGVSKDDLDKGLKSKKNESEPKTPCSSDDTSGCIGVGAEVEAHKSLSDSASERLTDEIWQSGWNAFGMSLKHNLIDPAANVYESQCEARRKQDEEFHSFSKGFSKGVGDAIEWGMNVDHEIKKYLFFPF